MTNALRRGWRLAVSAPAVFLGAWVLTLAAGFLLSTAVGGPVEVEPGLGLVARSGEYRGISIGAGAQPGAAAIADQLARELLGFGAIPTTLSPMLIAKPFNAALAGVVCAWLLGWTFAMGGVLARFARGAPLRAPAFLSACRTSFFPLLRLGVLVGLSYWALLVWVNPWLGRLTMPAAGVTGDPGRLQARALVSALFVLGMALVSVVSDFARIRLVVEDRLSAVAVVAASARFIRRRLARVGALFAANIVLQLLLATLWLSMAPLGYTSAWVIFLIGQIYLLVRLVARLALIASEVTFFQDELGGYPTTGEAEPIWPDSPAADPASGVSASPHR
ncbi:MAG: hypothetical protein ABI051_17865 [Vicinamibacterales bacterium]